MASNLQEEIHRRAAFNRSQMVGGDNPLIVTPGTDGPLLADAESTINTDPADEAFYADGELSLAVRDDAGAEVTAPDALAEAYDPDTGALREGFTLDPDTGDVVADDGSGGEPDVPEEDEDFRDLAIPVLRQRLVDAGAEVGFDKDWHKSDYVYATVERMTVPELRAKAKALGYPAADVNSANKDALIDILTGEVRPTPVVD